MGNMVCINHIIAVCSVLGIEKRKETYSNEHFCLGFFTDHDYNCLKFALEHGVDAVSQSFVENGKDIQQVREAAQKLGHHPFIIAKIERSRALDNLDNISEESTCQNLMFSYGVFPVHVSEHPRNRKPLIKEKLQSVGVEGNLVVLTEGPSRQYPDRDNRMEILDLSR